MRIKIIFFLLVLGIFLIRLMTLINQQPVQNTDYAFLHQQWLHSQYNLGEGYEFLGNMSDEDLRTLAALDYIKGGDPSRVNFEDPPLAKYLFGLSYILFGNIFIVQVIASGGILIFTYLLTSKIVQNFYLRLIPVVLLLNDGLYLERSTTVNLDVLQLFFLMLTLLLLMSDQMSKKRSLFMGIFIGAVMSSKVLFIGLVCLLFVLMVLKLQNLKSYMYYSFVVFFSSIGVYLMSYIVFFIYHSLIDFVFLHERIFRLYRSYLPEYPWFEIWRILLLGKWRTWFATPEIQPVSEFWLAWPISTLLSFMLLIKKKVLVTPPKIPDILLGWVILYLLFQSFHVVFPRYLLLVLPFLYILATYNLSSTLLNIVSKRK